MKDSLNITGKLRFVLHDSQGRLLSDQEGPNLIVTTGKAQIAALLAGSSTQIPLAMAVGTSGTPPDITNTALGGELARVAFTSSVAVGAQTTYTANFGSGVATGTILEAGLFSTTVANSGTMTSRSTSLSVVKGATDTLQIVWTLTVN